MAGKTQQKAGQLAGKAKQKTKSQVAAQKQRASDKLGHMAKALRQTGDNLRNEQQGKMAEYADSAAEQVERFSGYLTNRSPEELMHETERFARRDPALFLGGAFALGILGARFLKSSSPSPSSGSPQRRPLDRPPNERQSVDAPITAARAETPSTAATPGTPAETETTYTKEET